MAKANTNWTITKGEGPLVAVSLHSGSALREEVRELLAVDETARRHEEDIFTDRWTEIAPTRVVLHTSRFEVDMNRRRKKAVYLTPDDAWGLKLWKEAPPTELLERSLKLHDRFYAEMEALLREKAERHGRFVVFDIHSYCHYCRGPDSPPGSTDENPEINLGTGSMEREKWAPVVESFLRDMRSFEYPGGKLDVRENVKFRGGYFPSWVHETFPDEGCALAVEVKKFYMDEWAGQPYAEHVEAVGRALGSTVPNILEILKEPG
ncbi:MAG: N-formylglutamate amidohydrolase [Nitrospirota bacterium]